MNDIRTLDPARTALVVIDMQRVFMDADQVFGNAYARGIAPAVNRLVDAFHAAGSPVIWTRQTVSDEAPLAMPDWQYDLTLPAVAQAVAVMRAGTAAHALHPIMHVGAHDPVIDKYRYSAFLCPAGALQVTLDVTLGYARIECLVIVGTLTNCCCDSTARDGNMLGYQTILVSDACAAPTDEEHNAALMLARLNFADVKTVAEVEALLSAGKDA